jgi:hypothetical protein
MLRTLQQTRSRAGTFSDELHVVLAAAMTLKRRLLRADNARSWLDARHLQSLARSPILCLRSAAQHSAIFYYIPVTYMGRGGATLPRPSP